MVPRRWPMLAESDKAETSPANASARQRILDAARRHFFAHGFRGVTMEELAVELGMSKKTLYAHFAGKTALVEALLLTKFHEADKELATIAAECATDFAAGLQRLLGCLQRHTDEIKPPFVRDLGRETPEIFRIVEERRREIIRRHFGGLLAEGRREGLIRKDVPPTLMLEILLAAVQTIMVPPKMTELGLTPKTGLTSILNVFLEGVMTPEGRSRV
jgi:AcrR family transcriptional regulator